AIASPITVVGNTQHALHAADGTTDAGSDRAADNAANRACDPVAFTGAIPRAADNALPVRQMRNREQRQNAGRQRKSGVYRGAARQGRCLRLHGVSSWRKNGRFAVQTYNADVMQWLQS